MVVQCIATEKKGQRQKMFAGQPLTPPILIGFMSLPANADSRKMYLQK